MTRDYTAMKRMRHASALAVCGWYLMGPPLNRATGVIYFAAPVSHWSNTGLFDTGTECAKNRAARIANARNKPKP